MTTSSELGTPTGAPGLRRLGGDGTPAVVCHATGFCAGAYTPLADRLARDHQVLGIDFHGPAGSLRAGRTEASYERAAEDLLEGIDRAGCGPAYLLGHSMGGAIALIAAREAPELVRGAYVYEPAVVADGVDLGPVRTAFIDGIRRRRGHFASTAETIREFASKAPYSAFRRDALAAFVEHGTQPAADGGVTLNCTPEEEAAWYACGITASAFASVTVPVAVAWGEGDEMGVGLAPSPVARVIPHARSLAHAGLGHFGPFQAPERIAEQAASVFREMAADASEDDLAPANGSGRGMAAD